MNKLSTILSGALAGLVLAVGVSFVGNLVGQGVANAAANTSCIKTVDGINFVGDAGDKSARARMRLDKGCGTHTLVMKSYYAQSATITSPEDHKSQVLFATSPEKNFTDATKACIKNGQDCEALNVAMFSPSCFYQVDIVDVAKTNTVVVSRTGGDHDCTPTPPMYKCVSMTAKQVGVLTAGITDYQIAAHNATYLRTTVQWGDGASDTRVIPQGMGHVYPTAGTYTITATSYFQIVGQFGQVKEVAAAPCTYPITFTPEVPNKIQVCELATKHIITIDEKDFDASKHSKNLADCDETPKQIYVCEISTKNILTIREDEYGTAKYPTDKYTKNLDLCLPKYISVCDLATKSLLSIEEGQFDASKHTTDLSKCKTTVTPPPATLVNTGPGSTVALAGATGIVAAAAHAFWRRRNV